MMAEALALISQLISAAMEELFEVAVLPVPPDELESFEAEAEIDLCSDLLHSVIICGIGILIAKSGDEYRAFHSWRMADYGA